MSAARKPGLGRGLGDLIQRTDPGMPPTEHKAPAGARFEEVPVESIRPNPRQPRTVFDEDALTELQDSIAEVGLLQPVVVRPLGSGEYELVMGERRLRAATMAGLERIPAIIRPTEEADLLRDALLENLHRAQLNPLEEAAAYQQLMEDFGCTQEELSRRIKRSRPQISNTIRLLNLPAAVQRKVAAGVISAGHARALLSLAATADMERIAGRIVAENLSVRAVEELVAIGESDAPARRRTRSAEPVQIPAAAHMEQELTDLLDTRVTVHTRGKKGRIVIEFADLEDLDRLGNILLEESGENN